MPTAVRPKPESLLGWPFTISSARTRRWQTARRWGSGVTARSAPSTAGLVPSVVLVLGAAMAVFDLLLVAATFVAWGLWASWSITGVEVSNYMMPGAVMLGVVG